MGLTRNQALVLDTLTRADAPLSAYTILDQLRDDGFRAPPQVYRALDKLVERGRVHRLESINAFVACKHPACGAHATVAFAICERCGCVSEIGSDALVASIGAIAQSEGFAVTKTTVELRGICARCGAA